MTQVEEAFTDTTMERPAPFLDFVRKQTRQLEPQDSSGETVVTRGRGRGWSLGKRVFSGETLVITGRAEVAVTTEAVATGKAWLPQSCRAWDWSRREPAFSGETLVITGQAGVAVAAGQAWLPQSCFLVHQEGGNVVFLFVSHADVVVSDFKPEHPIILELYDLLKEDSNDEYEEQTITKAKSVSNAIIFATKVLEKVKMELQHMLRTLRYLKKRIRADSKCLLLFLSI